MKKVLFVVTTLDVGGLETYLLRFLSFAQHNIDATVFCKSGKGGELEDKYEKLGVTIIKHKISYFSILDLLKLYSFLKKEKFEAICDFTGDFAGFPLLVARLTGIQKRLSFYRESTYQFNRDPLRIFYKTIVNFLVSKNSTKILSNSEAALDLFHPNWKSNQKNYQVIQNGVPSELFELEFDAPTLRRELGIPNNAFVIGHVGRFHYSKNHKTIIKVAEHLCNKYNNVYFLLCGLGVKEGIEKIAGISKINSRIIMPGVRNDIPNVLRIMDAYYFPSITEGQPNALIEAMIVGLPFVASDIDPIKECVPNEFYGCLVPPKDIDATSELLSTYIEKTNKIDFQKIKNFAQNEFRADVKFNQFLKEL